MEAVICAANKKHIDESVKIRAVYLVYTLGKSGERGASEVVSLFSSLFFYFHRVTLGRWVKRYKDFGDVKRRKNAPRRDQKLMPGGPAACLPRVHIA